MKKDREKIRQEDAIPLFYVCLFSLITSVSTVRKEVLHIKWKKAKTSIKAF